MKWWFYNCRLNLNPALYSSGKKNGNSFFFERRIRKIIFHFVFTDDKVIQIQRIKVQVNRAQSYISVISNHMQYNN